MSRSELIADISSFLESQGYEIYQIEGLRKYFDIVAVAEGEDRIFIKVLTNIDNLNSFEGCELRSFAKAFSSKTYVIGQKAGVEPLSDGVLYQRFGNDCLSPQTFKQLIGGDCVNRFTKRGQHLIGIDGEQLKEMRSVRGISQEDLATALGCSGQTVYRIECQNRIKEDLFEKLLDYLGDGIKEISVRIESPFGENELAVADPLKKKITKEYFRLKLRNTSFRIPIDFAIEEKPMITPVSASESELRAKQRVASGLSAALDCRIIHLTKEKKKRRLEYISFDELHSMSSKEEMFERFD